MVGVGFQAEIDFAACIAASGPASSSSDESRLNSNSLLESSGGLDPAASIWKSLLESSGREGLRRGVPFDAEGEIEIFLGAAAFFEGNAGIDRVAERDAARPVRHAAGHWRVQHRFLVVRHLQAEIAAILRIGGGTTRSKSLLSEAALEFFHGRFGARRQVEIAAVGRLA